MLKQLQVKPFILKYGSIEFYNYWIYNTSLFTVNVQDDVASYPPPWLYQIYETP